MGTVETVTDSGNRGAVSVVLAVEGRQVGQDSKAGMAVMRDGMDAVGAEVVAPASVERPATAALVAPAIASSLRSDHVRL